MCCSAWPASFSRTITGTWEVMVDGRLMHVLWYQNRVGTGSTTTNNYTLSNKLRSAIYEAAVPPPSYSAPEPTVEEPNFSGEGNCLIIPLLGTWESIRLLNTLQTPNLLLDVSDALAMPVSRASGASLSMTFGSSGGGLVFLKFDIYDIVIAERPGDIPAALSQIRPEKRPKVNDAVFGMLDRWYGCPVAVCCFNDAQSGEAKPLGFAFEPLYPDKLVVYTLDAHDGNPPDPNKLVSVDHDIFVGSYLMKANSHAKIEFTDEIPADLRPYVLDKALGVSLTDTAIENGDFIFSTEQVRNGVFHGLRSLPPLAPSNVPRLGHVATRDFAYI